MVGSSHLGPLLRFKMSRMSLPPFERFYEQHREEIFGFLVRRLGRDRAEDAFQETFLRALRAYPKLRHGEHLRAWAYTIASRRRSAGARVPRRPARFCTARAPRRPAAADRARRGRAALRLRPRLLRHRRRPRIERDRRPSGGLGRHTPATTEGASMNAVTPDLDRRFRAAAADEGLLDAAYDFVDSPVGPLFVAASKRGVCRISYDAEPERELDR